MSVPKSQSSPESRPRSHRPTFDRPGRLLNAAPLRRQPIRMICSRPRAPSAGTPTNRFPSRTALQEHRARHDLLCRQDRLDHLDDRRAGRHHALTGPVQHPRPPRAVRAAILSIASLLIRSVTGMPATVSARSGTIVAVPPRRTRGCSPPRRSALGDERMHARGNRALRPCRSRARAGTSTASHRLRHHRVGSTPG